MQAKFVLKTLKKVAAISTGVAMLGATLTGAMALDLKDYPSPFVKDGMYDDTNVFVVGKNAMAADTLAALDVAANLQFLSKKAVTGAGSTVTVEGGKTEKVALGKGLSNTTFFNTELDDADVSSLFDGTISFGTSTYDTSEVLWLSDRNDPTVATSLTASEDDFKSNVFLTTARSKLVYRYKFDKTINMSLASTTNPLTLDFLGKKMKITNVADADTFTAYVGDEHYMKVSDSVTVSGKTVKLVSVSTTKAVVDVDGVTESITDGNAQSVNGIQVTVDGVFSRDKLEESSAKLVLGTISSKTYNDGDAYVGEDQNNPNWVWTLASLSASGTSQTFGVKNNFRKQSNSDKPSGVGECYKFPNDYLSVCLDSLTVADADLKDYTFERESNSDLSQAIGSGYATGTNSVYISTTATDGIELRAYTEDATTLWKANVSSTVKTQKLWIAFIAPVAINGSATMGNTTMDGNATLAVFYKDTSDSRVKLYGALRPEQSAVDRDQTLARINLGNTKDDNILLEYMNGSNVTAVNLRLDINGDSTNDLENSADDLRMVWGTSSGKFNQLGATATTEEAGELFWGAGPSGIGSKDEDHRTRYGLIVKNPKSNSASERVLVQIPSDQVFANVVVKGKSAKVSSAGTTFVPTKVSVVSKTNDEISDPSANNLIVVGGPCANPLAESLFGLSCDKWPYAAGEAVVKLAANGQKVALLIAGTDALDTRRAGKALAASSDYKFEGTEVLVKGATLTDIKVEKPAAAAAPAATA